MKDQLGVCKWWNDNKGYGFLSCGGHDVFAHYTEIQVEGFKTLHEGQEVIFDAHQGAKGPEAKNIRPRV